MQRRLPAALVVGFVLGAASLAMAVGVRLVLPASSRRVSEAFTLYRFAAAAASLLIAAGAFELRAWVGARRDAATVGAFGMGVVAAAVLFRFAIEPMWYALFPGTTTHVKDIEALLRWAVPIGYFVGVAGIAAVGLRPDAPASAAGVAIAAACAAFEHPIPPLFRFMSSPSTAAALLIVAIATGTCVAVLATARVGSGPAGVSWAPAHRGLTRAAVAIAWRIGLALSALPLLMIAILLRDTPLVTFFAIVIPLGGAIAGIVAIVAILEAARADADGAPGHRLAGAAAALVVGVMFDMYSLSLAIEVARGHGEADLEAHGWLLWILPCVGMLGLLLFLSSLGAIAARVECMLSREKLARVGTAMALALGAELWLADALSHDTHLGLGAVAMISIFLAAVMVICAIFVVQMTREVSFALAGTPIVPTAVARGRFGA